jgi:hypothetical protein
MMQMQIMMMVAVSQVFGDVLIQLVSTTTQQQTLDQQF